MIRSYKYRLYPNKEQAQKLNQQLEGHRYVYNQCLADRKNIWQKCKTSLSYYDQAVYYLPILRKDRRVAECNCSSTQQTVRRVDKTYQAFFKRLRSGEKPGFPRFKPRKQFSTFFYGTYGDGCRIKDERLYLQNIGLMKVKWHRSIPGKIKTLSITQKLGKWYACFYVEMPSEFLAPINKSIGLDVGLTHFYTDDSGNKVDNPRLYRESERKLRRLQRSVSRKKGGSNRRRKAVRLLAKHHQKIQNKRLDFCHKESTKIIKEFDFIAVEKLNIKGMVKNKRLSKSISDAGWNLFKKMLRNKAESAGREFIEVNPSGTSQICSGCGELVKKSLSVRIHECPSCSLVIDRDHNAAINILIRARPERSGVNVDAVRSRVA